MKKSLLRFALIAASTALIAACGSSAPDQAAQAAAPVTPAPVPATLAPPPAPAPVQTLDTATASSPAVVPYDAVFAVNPDGSVTPKVPVNAFGVGMGPGVTFGAGATFGGVDIGALKGHDLQAYREGGMLVVIGIRK